MPCVLHEILDRPLWVLLAAAARATYNKLENDVHHELTDLINSARNVQLYLTRAMSIQVSLCQSYVQHLLNIRFITSLPVPQIEA